MSFDPNHSLPPKKLYNALFEQAIPELLAGKNTIDPLVEDPNDRRLGLTLLAYPSEAVKYSIEGVISELHAAEPSQYYYPLANLHLTVLSIISCYEGFGTTGIVIREYIDLITKCLSSMPPFEIHVSGITASASGVLACGYFSAGSLDNIREHIRKGFSNSNLEQSMDSRYALEAAHLTIARYKTPIANAGFTGILEKYRSANLGSFTVGELVLASNDWYHTKSNILHNFRLG